MVSSEVVLRDGSTIHCETNSRFYHSEENLNHLSTIANREIDEKNERLASLGVIPKNQAEEIHERRAKMTDKNSLITRTRLRQNPRQTRRFNFEEVASTNTSRR